jgi:hypothetical protein
LCHATAPKSRGFSQAADAYLTPGPERAGNPYNWPMESLNLFGLFAVTAMLVTYALEDRSPRFILGFGGACALGSIYGFLFK